MNRELSVAAVGNYGGMNLSSKISCKKTYS